MKRLTEQDYINLANSRGFQWIGMFPPNTRTPTAWKCRAGHIWNAVFSNIAYNGSGCPRCSGRQKHAESDYREFAKKMQLVWLGPLPLNRLIYTKWKCSKGHTWNATLANISRGRGCPKCNYINRRLSESDYRAYAQKKGLEWIGPLPQNVNMKTWWKCQRGHLRFSTYKDLGDGINCWKCHLIDYRGDKHHNFRGGDRTNKHYGDGFDSKQKTRIKIRDNYTCMLTGKYLGKKKRVASVHHIVPARIAPSIWRNSTHNLITLSPKLHPWAEFNLKESIPLLRKVLYDRYGYNFSDMQDYDLARLVTK